MVHIGPCLKNFPSIKFAIKIGNDEQLFLQDVLVIRTRTINPSVKQSINHISAFYCLLSFSRTLESFVKEKTGIREITANIGCVSWVVGAIFSWVKNKTQIFRENSLFLSVLSFEFHKLRSTFSNFRSFVKILKIVVYLSDDVNIVAKSFSALPFSWVWKHKRGTRG